MEAAFNLTQSTTQSTNLNENLNVNPDETLITTQGIISTPADSGADIRWGTKKQYNIDDHFIVPHLPSWISDPKKLSRRSPNREEILEIEMFLGEKYYPLDESRPTRLIDIKHVDMSSSIIHALFNENPGYKDSIENGTFKINMLTKEDLEIYTFIRRIDDQYSDWTVFYKDMRRYLSIVYFLSGITPQETLIYAKLSIPELSKRLVVINDELNEIFDTIMQTENRDQAVFGIKCNLHTPGVTSKYDGYISFKMNDLDIEITMARFGFRIHINVLYKLWTIEERWIIVYMAEKIIRFIKEKISYTSIRINIPDNNMMTIFPANYPEVSPVLISAAKAQYCKMHSGDVLKGNLTDIQVECLNKILSDKTVMVRNSDFSAVQDALQQILVNDLTH